MGRVGRGGVDIEGLGLEADVLEHATSGRPLGLRPSRDREGGGPRRDREEPAPPENVGGAAGRRGVHDRGIIAEGPAATRSRKPPAD